MFDWLNQGLGFILNWCYSFTNNYALALLIFAFLVKLILFPLGIKQQKNMVKQAKLRPREMAIRKKYAGRNDRATQQKQQEEIMNLYQEENFNPMGGCLPLLIQLPILFALLGVITKPLSYICQFSEAVVAELGKIAAGIMNVAPESFKNQIDIIKVIRQNTDKFSNVTVDGELVNIAEIPNFDAIGGLDLSLNPQDNIFSLLLLIPILTFVFSILSSKITKKLSYQAPGAEEAANNSSMKIMEYSMPLLSVWIAFSWPAAIGLYWIYQNIFTVLQQVVLAKMYPLPKFTQEDYDAAEKAAKKNNNPNKKVQRDPNAPKVRSLHHIDDDEFEEIYGKKKEVKSSSVNAPKTVAKEEIKNESAEEIKGESADQNDDNIPKLKDDKVKYKKKDQ